MTNSPNENRSHDLSADDLQLTAEKYVHGVRGTIGQTEDAPPEILIAPSRHRAQPKKKKHTLRNILLIALACLVGMMGTAVITVVTLQDRGRAHLLPPKDVVVEIPETIQNDPTVEVKDKGRTVIYKDETYRFNESRTNILCIGVDKTSLDLENGVVGSGGQADTLVLLSIDTATGEMDALSISRDTMTDIDEYDEAGNFVGTNNTQLCLAYAYGDGREKSGETTARAVSRLLYNIPISTYFAVDLNSIATLNDAVGGVTVTLLSDFRTSDGITHAAGETVTLYGSDALWYVRMRDTEQLASNADRMARQEQYLTAFASKALTATKSDLQVPLNLFSAVSQDSVTNLTPSKITFLTTKLIRHAQMPSFSAVQGEIVKSEDDGYAEFHVDDTALYEQVLDIFYTKE